MGKEMKFPVWGDGSWSLAWNRWEFTSRRTWFNYFQHLDVGKQSESLFVYPLPAARQTNIRRMVENNCF